MAYIVNADDPSRPLDTDPRKQGAEELRALKARLIQTRTALEGADSTNAAAAAAALAAANAAQSSANNAQSSANAAQSSANAAQGAANNAQSSADSAAGAAAAAAAAAALSVIKIKAIMRIASGSGTVTVPNDCTSCLVFGKGGDWNGFNSSDNTAGVASSAAPTNTAVLSVAAGETVAYSIGAINSFVGFGSLVPPTASTFGAFTARAAPKIPNQNGGASAGFATAGWLLLIFY